MISSGSHNVSVVEQTILQKEPCYSSNSENAAKAAATLFLALSCFCSQGDCPGYYQPEVTEGEWTLFL